MAALKDENDFWIDFQLAFRDTLFDRNVDKLLNFVEPWYQAMLKNELPTWLVDELNAERKYSRFETYLKNVRGTVLELHFCPKDDKERREFLFNELHAARVCLRDF